MSLSSNVEDLQAAADYLASEYDAPSLLVGHSLGGSAVLIAALRIDSSEAVVTLGAPYSPDHVTRLLKDKSEKIEEQGKATITIAGRDFTIKKRFLDDVTSFSSAEKLSKLDKPLLIMHSPVDNVVNIDNAAKIFKAAKHPKSFISLADMDHLLSKKEDSHYAADLIAAWASRYV
jgi:putative redox protein